MKRTTLFLNEELEGDLRALARRHRRSMADVIREALGEYVAHAKHEGARRPGFVGVGASGHNDTAERHEELLWKRPEPPAAPRHRRPRRA